MRLYSLTTTNCNWYPNAEMALPENTASIGDFAFGALGIHDGVSGTLMVHGQTILVDRKPVTITLDDAATKNPNMIKWYFKPVHILTVEVIPHPPPPAGCQSLFLECAGRGSFCHSSTA